MNSMHNNKSLWFTFLHLRRGWNNLICLSVLVANNPEKYYTIKNNIVYIPIPLTLWLEQSTLTLTLTLRVGTVIGDGDGDGARWTLTLKLSGLIIWFSDTARLNWTDWIRHRYR